ncbi:hypothetical protein GGI02_004531 [Coemansia sp. RSA 2322]|uniref:Ribosomal protein L19 n=1 Tax=Coemansia thaxteri TaxID=2663907 RepID=A0A9W8BJM1_9FUNG|nr:hypothetical protein H4R26_003021 [Coemansia thaxteri]KAJ2465960.1 hypothetical protein GGI02_004531 [Coemansia sp. RSA 2322]KAJ2470771.1 hypothetical protein EV174_006060 [Coemansia sp. RSA 2320]
MIGRSCVFGQQLWSAAARALGQRVSGAGEQLVRPLVATRTFSQSALLLSSTAQQPTYIVSQPQFDQPMVLAVEKRPNVMKVVEREAISRANVDGRADLFVRRAAPKDRLCAGDVVCVETLNSISEGALSSTFTGVCIAIYRRGIDTSFILRNVVQRVGVEMRFMAYSPLVKRIEIVHKGTGYRRAKLFYLRENPGKAFQLKLLKKMSK